MKRLSIALVAALFFGLFGCTVEQEAPEIKVESISIDQDDITLTEGESVTLTATVLPENAVDKTIEWSSSNDEVVMIASNGKAKALAVGSAEITATAGERTDFITITVTTKTIHITGISLTPSSLTLKVGQSQELMVEITPSNATEKTVTWSSSNDEVASVENGIVKGLSPGSVTVTATTVDGKKTAECVVTVKANVAPSVTRGADRVSAVSAVLLGKANLESSASSDLMVGFQYSLSSGSLPSNSITVEAVDADSEYNYSTGISELEPNTTYYYRSLLRQNGQDYYGETKSFTTLELSSMLETLDPSDVEPTSANLNAKLDLKDVLFKSLSYGFLWGFSEELQNKTLEATSISDNLFSSAMTGLPHKTQYWYKAFASIDGHTFYGTIKSFTTTVVPVTSVELGTSEYTFHTIGTTLLLLETVLPEDATDKAVLWTSDDESVATVNSNGLVTAVGNGNATITVKTVDQEKTATCQITVAQYVTSVTLDKTSLTLQIGDKETLLVTSVSPDNAADKTVVWTSSDENVAMVNSSGLVAALSKGECEIRATANDGSGVYASCSVTVKEQFGPVDLGLSSGLKWANFNLGANAPEEYGDYYAWGETETKSNYNWSTYKWCNGAYDSLTKYNNSSSFGTVDNKTVLNPEDDVVHVNLGGRWRMPTDAEWTELMTECTRTWTTENGVNGRRVTGPNGNSIFLPAAGIRYDADLCGPGSYGKYWSSSLGTMGAPGYAWSVYLDSDYYGRFDDYRCYGFSVRPVSE